MISSPCAAQSVNLYTNRRYISKRKFNSKPRENTMKNSLIAVAAALACTGAAYAQSNVQLTGMVDMYAGSVKYAGQDRNSVVGSGGMTTSWWGLKGTEDLGGGLKADFNLTSFFRADTGTPGRFNGDNFFSRDANIGLSGSFGRVGLGRGMAPNFLPTILTNPFGDSFTISPLVLHANVPTGFGPGAPWGSSRLTTPSDTGWSNQIVYSTPSFGGLKANIHYQFGEQSGNGQSSKKNVGLNLMYGAGPLNLVAFYERAQVNNPAGTTVIPTTTDWMVGGTYDFTVVKLYGTYGQSKVKDGNAPGWTAGKNSTYSVGLDVPVKGTGGTFKAAAARTKAEWGNNMDANRTTYTLGYNHFLSKRTDVYTAVMYDRISDATPKSGTSVVAGVRHRF